MCQTTAAHILVCVCVCLRVCLRVCACVCGCGCAGRCGVLAQQVVEASVVHNNISYFRYTGVSVGWTWGYAATSVHSNIVGWNYIHHIALDELSDLGCVAACGDRGVVPD